MLLKDYYPSLKKKFCKIKFTGISFNSKKIKKGNTFFAIKGNKIDGNLFINDAIKNGAKIIITEKYKERFKKKILFLKNKNPRKLLSEFSVKLYKEKPNNLIAVTESNNARYLPSEFTEKWWNSLSEKNYLEYNDGYEIFQKENTMLSNDDHLGMLTLEREMNGYIVNVFEAFIPMIQMEETDTAKVQWTIIKN